MSRFLLLFLILARLSTAGLAQPTGDTVSTDSTDVYESLERTLDETLSDTEMNTRTAEVLTDLAYNPLDPNRATASDLSTIPSLSLSRARRIVQYRRTHGPFSTIEEIIAVEGIDERALASVRPYLHVPRSDRAATDEESSPSGPSIGTILSDLDLTFVQRATRSLDLGRGFDADSTRTTFRGPPGRLTSRLRLSYDRHVQIALTADKDPGEAVRWHPESSTYGFDHVAGNVTLQDMGRLETLVIGDFTTQYGQGAALWHGMSFGKGRDPVSPLLRSGRGIVPFQSTSEDMFLRGIAATVKVHPSLSATGFVSKRQRDATLDSSAIGSSDGDEPIPARTLSTGGLHRTRHELARKNAFGVTTVGGAVEYRSGPLHLGLTGYRSRFDRPFRPPDEPYRQFNLSGRRTSMTSAFGSAVLGRYTLVGEVARTPAGEYGAVAGAALDHKGGVQALLFARRFPRSFGGLYNGAVGESGSTQNEVGVYTGVRVQITNQWRVSAYVDQYEFPWLRFSVPRPTSGIDARAVIEYEPRPWLASYVQVRTERSEGGTERRGPYDRKLQAVERETRTSARWHTEYTFSDALTLRTRIQLSRYSTETSSLFYGALLSQGVRLRPTTSLRFDVRHAFFDTDGFESRIYAHEHDLLYSFSVPVLFGRGQRSYALVQFEPTPTLTVEAKYGLTWYPHRDTIGSGLNETAGHRSRDLRLQLRWTL